MVAIPNNIYIHNNSYFKKYNKIFTSFSSVFDYREALKIMRQNDDAPWSNVDSYAEYLGSQSPYQVGSLVCARKGLFFPKLPVFQSKIEALASRFCYEFGLSHRLAELTTYLSGRDYVTTDKNLVALFNQFNDWCAEEPSAVHPVGVILGKSRNISPHSGRELYRVSFAETIYEEVHPIQLEILNEV